MAKSEDKSVVTYTTDSGSKVKISPAIIRKWLVNGGGQVSDQEAMLFLMLCKQQRLDPFLREAYLIKFGSERATMVTGKEVFTKRAERHEKFRGMHAGIVVMKAAGSFTQGIETQEMEQRVGSLLLEGETLVGGWAKVWKADREVPYENTVSFSEYVGRKSNGEVNRQWSTKPATMIRKVALVQTLREVFPETFSGMYDPDEMSHIDSDDLTDSPVTEERDVSPAATRDAATTEPAEPLDPTKPPDNSTRQSGEKSEASVEKSSTPPSETSDAGPTETEYHTGIDAFPMPREKILPDETTIRTTEDIADNAKRPDISSEDQAGLDDARGKSDMFDTIDDMGEKAGKGNTEEAVQADLIEPPTIAEDEGLY